MGVLFRYLTGVALTQISAFIVRQKIRLYTRVFKLCVRCMQNVWGLSRWMSETFNGLILQIWVHYGYEDNSKGQNKKHILVTVTVTHLKKYLTGVSCKEFLNDWWLDGSTSTEWQLLLQFTTCTHYKIYVCNFQRHLRTLHASAEKLAQPLILASIQKYNSAIHNNNVVIFIG